MLCPGEMLPVLLLSLLWWHEWDKPVVHWGSPVMDPSAAKGMAALPSASSK